jgi:hypothetical protein
MVLVDFMSDSVWRGRAKRARSLSLPARCAFGVTKAQRAAHEQGGRR